MPDIQGDRSAALFRTRVQPLNITIIHAAKNREEQRPFPQGARRADRRRFTPEAPLPGGGDAVA